MGASFLITLREGLEAALVISIVLAYLARTGNRHHFRNIWLGTGAAILASLTAGAIVFLTVGELTGRSEEIFEGIAMFIAVGILSYMVIWMKKQARNIKAHLEAQIQEIGRRDKTMSFRFKLPALLMIVLALVVIAVGCAPTAPIASPTSPTVKTQTLTVYSGRAEGLVKPIIDQFSKSTGINVQVRYAGTSELAATILEEGKNSPADVFFAQDPGGLGAVTPLLTKLPESITAQVEPMFRPSDGKWVGISGRARVIAYNTQKVKESDLPDDIFGLTDAKWKGRIGWAPTNASFQAMVTAMRKLWGEEKTKQWLAGIQANNPKVYANNTAQITALGTGEIDVAMPNHYYLYGFLQDKGETFPVRNYHPRAGGPGALILVAGAGILDTSKNKEAAQKFIEFMLSPVAQQYFAGQTFEYPVIKGVKTHRLLTPLSDIKSPEISMADMADLKGTLNLLRETGIVP